MGPIRRALRRLLTPPLVFLGVLLVLVEEVLWAGLGRLMAQLARLPLLARLEAALRGLPPYPALAVFLAPIAMVLPVKMLALWLLSQGRWLPGLACLLAAKLGGMALCARLYALCGPSLHQLRWFARLEGALRRASAWAHDRLASLPGWMEARRWIHDLIHSRHEGGDRSGTWLRRRLQAARRLGRATLH